MFKIVVLILILSIIHACTREGSNFSPAKHSEPSGLGE